jgi:hypothetical protein
MQPVQLSQRRRVFPLERIAGLQFSSLSAIKTPPKATGNTFKAKSISQSQQSRYVASAMSGSTLAQKGKTQPVAGTSAAVSCSTQ